MAPPHQPACRRREQFINGLYPAPTKVGVPRGGRSFTLTEGLVHSVYRHRGRWRDRTFPSLKLPVNWRLPFFLSGFLMLCLGPALATEQPAGAMRGLPLTRFYPFDEIGDVSRGAQLSFDSAGRLVVVHDGVYIALNDGVWLPTEIQSAGGVRAQRVARDRDGTCYYSSLGSWGVLETTEQGQLRIEPFSPANRPKWTTTSNFAHILCRPEGVYFIGEQGVVYVERGTRKFVYIEIPSTAYAFALGETVYVSSHSLGTLQLDLDRGTFTEADRGIFGGSVIDRVALLSEGRAIMTSTGRRLALYEHGRLTTLDTALGEPLPARITALQSLIDGNVAVAVSGHGLYIITPRGEIITALTQPEYRSIIALATNENGVLWASTESGVAKILCGASITAFGQALGLPVGWPQIVRWEGQTIMASNGRVYEPLPVSKGEPVRFRLMPKQPHAGAWGIAAWKEWLLLANAEAVFAARQGEPFQRIAAGATRLAMLEPDICLAISEREIVALRHDGDAWRECAPRVPGMGPPAVVHSSKHAVWVEHGANRASRISLVDGKLATQVFDRFPWPDPQWINVSVIGDVAILNGPESGRILVDEKTGEIIKRPSLSATLNRLPYWAARVREDETGRLWVSHAHGVIALTPQGDGFEADTNTYRLITEHWPLVQPLGGDIWISSARSLYHVDTSRPHTLAPATRPRLVSIRDARTNRELVGANHSDTIKLNLPYSQNSLAFRFFAGNYTSRRTPDYQFRLNDEDWSSLDASAVLRLTDLREGAYRLAIRLTDASGPIGETATVDFSIAPPWQRTWYAFTAYAVVGVVSGVGLVRLLLYRARARNAALERIVERRTEELKSTMQQLQRETRTAATLAERNRLAGEIHDSLEQGFSGLVLHLDTTAGLVECPPAIRRALAAARNMVAFSRNEVRHAVWDLHSPMLEEGDLSAALKRLIAQSVPDPDRARVSIKGEPCSLSSTIEHHLLRIAQEAIANAVKHAQAERLDVELAYRAGEVSLSIRDDGRGFDTRMVMANPQNGHFGLRSLRGRAAKIGATLEISSELGSGTCITVRVPFAT